MLLKGLGATLTGYSIQGSLKYGLYAILKTVVKDFLPTSSIFVTWVLASMLADFMASTALCPLEVGYLCLSPTHPPTYLQAIHPTHLLQPTPVSHPPTYPTQPNLPIHPTHPPTYLLQPNQHKRPRASAWWRTRPSQPARSTASRTW